MIAPPLLLTPGPLTTSPEVKRAALRDWGSREAGFLAMNRAVLDRLVEIVHGDDRFAAVPVQGSGTFAVEAMLTSLVPPGGACLTVINGSYGRRAARILEIGGRRAVICENPEDRTPSADAIDAALAADASLSHVFVVHCETTSGILNPLAEIAAVTARHGRRLLVDAMSTFGALPIDSRSLPFEALAAASGKCLEGLPGLGFVLCRRDALAAAGGRATTLVLDLHEQWLELARSGQYRFTPPVQVIAALSQALAELDAEGGPPGRLQRYEAHCDRLSRGMDALGFRAFLPPPLRAPIILTFEMPRTEGFDFARFYASLLEKGFVIYPGKLTQADSFRVGCIGRITAADVDRFLSAATAALTEMGLSRAELTRQVRDDGSAEMENSLWCRC